MTLSLNLLTSNIRIILHSTFIKFIQIYLSLLLPPLLDFLKNPKILLILSLVKYDQICPKINFWVHLEREDEDLLNCNMSLSYYYAKYG